MRKIATLLVMLTMATAGLTVAQAQHGQFGQFGQLGPLGQFGEINSTLRGRGQLEIGNHRDNLNSLSVSLRRDGTAEIRTEGSSPLILTGRITDRDGDAVNVVFRGGYSGVNGRGRIHLSQRGGWNRQAEVERVEVQGRARGERFSLNFEARGGFGGGRRGPRDRDDRNDRFGGRMVWSGRVDALTEIHIHGEQVWFADLEGQRTFNTRYSFTNRLPQREVGVRVNKLRGRGSVDVIQHPSRANNYTAVVRIMDSQRGADNYEFELTW